MFSAKSKGKKKKKVCKTMKMIQPSDFETDKSMEAINYSDVNSENLNKREDTQQNLSPWDIYDQQIKDRNKCDKHHK